MKKKDSIDSREGRKGGTEEQISGRQSKGCQMVMALVLNRFCRVFS